MVSENVQRNLNNPLTPFGKGDRGQAYIDEDKIIPYGEVLGFQESFTFIKERKVKSLVL